MTGAMSHQEKLQLERASISKIKRFYINSQDEPELRSQQTTESYGSQLGKSLGACKIFG
jgi:hypothetical protein